MDTIRIECAQATRPSDARSTANEAPAAEIRTLDDWELALASGGEDLPEWP
jgi:hypothetical protein